MKDCCDKYVMKSEPKNPKAGTFKEIHNCNDCESRIKITFEEIVGLGDDYKDYAVIAAEYVK